MTVFAIGTKPNQTETKLKQTETGEDIDPGPLSSASHTACD
jgi:hypothetical protein